MYHHPRITVRPTAMMAIACASLSVALLLDASALAQRNRASRGSYQSSAQHAAQARSPRHGPTGQAHQPDNRFGTGRGHRIPSDRPEDRRNHPGKQARGRHPGHNDQENVGVGIFLDPFDSDWDNYYGNRVGGHTSSAWLHYAAPVPGFAYPPTRVESNATSDPIPKAPPAPPRTDDQDNDILLQAPEQPVERLPPPRS